MKMVIFCKVENFLFRFSIIGFFMQRKPRKWLKKVILLSVILYKTKTKQKKGKDGKKHDSEN